MADHLNAGKFGSVIGIPFFVANAVTNKTNEDLAMGGGNTLQVMPTSGSVVGISVRSSADVTTGSASFAAHKDGTEFAQTSALSVSLTGTISETYATVRPGVMTFAAGEAVGVSYTSTTTMDPTNTNDFDVLLFVQLDPN